MLPKNGEPKGKAGEIQATFREAMLRTEGKSRIQALWVVGLPSMHTAG